MPTSSQTLERTVGLSNYLAHKLTGAQTKKANQLKIGHFGRKGTVFLGSLPNSTLSATPDFTATEWPAVPYS